MRKILERLDRAAAVNQENRLAVVWLERTAFVFLVLMVLAAPHSIAATQTAWLVGMAAWIARMFFAPRRPLVRTPLDRALWVFFAWSVVTSVFSYAPDISLDKLRGVALFLIFYFVVNSVRTRGAAVFLGFALIASCMFNAAWTAAERVVGRGVEIYGVAPESPLAKLTLKDGDTIVRANRRRVGTPEEVLAEIERGGAAKIEFYRPDYYLTVEVRRENLLAADGATAAAAARLGFRDWKKSRNWRSMGFYGHWTTYSEVLQLIAALAFGLFIASMAGSRFFPAETTRKSRKKPDSSNEKPDVNESPTLRRRGFKPFLILLVCLGGLLFALLLTATRASQAGFAAAALAIVLLVGNRKMLFGLTAAVLPLAILGFVLLQQSRNVGFVDQKDVSTQYRQTVYREGFDLWTANARNFLLGVGMDSIKRYAGQWRLFDEGRLPMGHFHSTPLQLVVERGLPALFLWLWIVWVYGRTLVYAISKRDVHSLNPTNEHPQSAIRNFKSGDWREQGILLGCFGALVGFFVGGLVHYNLGDQEVAMIFFLQMGLSVTLARPEKEIAGERTENV